MAYFWCQYQKRYNAPTALLGAGEEFDSANQPTVLKDGRNLEGRQIGPMPGWIMMHRVDSGVQPHLTFVSTAKTLPCPAVQVTQKRAM